MDLQQPWPWYVVGPIIGLMVPSLLLLGNKSFGFSSNLRHLCAAAVPCGLEFFRYDWKRKGGWNLWFLVGALVGGALAGTLLASPDPIALSARTRSDLQALGLSEFAGLVPRELFSWGALLTPRGFVLIVFGGFCVGFGTAWAGGCTSGHAISGLASLERASLLAVAGFFAGGLAATHGLLPVLLR